MFYVMFWRHLAEVWRALENEYLQQGLSGGQQQLGPWVSSVRLVSVHHIQESEQGDHHPNCSQVILPYCQTPPHVSSSLHLMDTSVMRIVGNLETLFARSTVMQNLLNLLKVKACLFCDYTLHIMLLSI